MVGATAAAFPRPCVYSCVPVYRERSKHRRVKLSTEGSEKNSLKMPASRIAVLLKSMKYKKADTKTVLLLRYCEIVRFPPNILGAGRAQLLISIVLCYKDGSDGQCVVNAV